MKKLLLGLTMVCMAVGLVGCTESQADIASYNLSLEADNFNVVRQVTVINCIEGDVLFQMTGRLSIDPDMAENQLEIIVENEKGYYTKHFIGLSDNVTYVVEQLQVENVDAYNYTLNYNPKMWIPIGFKNID